MISSSDSYSTVELDNFYAILPQGNLNLINKFKKKINQDWLKCTSSLNIQVTKMVHFFL